MYFETQRYDEVALALDSAEGLLVGLPAPRTAPVVRRIAEVRAAMATVIGPAEARRISAAERQLAKARADMALGYTLPASIEATIQDAERYLAGLAAKHQWPLLAEIEALRAQLAGTATAATTDLACVEGELDRHLASAESNLETDPQRSSAALQRFAERIGTDQALELLTADAIVRYVDRAADLTAALAESIKSRALGRALPLLRQLEQRLATEPFADLDQPAAQRATSELRALRHRVQAAISTVPTDDPDIRAVQDRLRLADRTIDQAGAAWGKALLELLVDTSWDAIRVDIAGWQGEADTLVAGLLDEPDMPKTRSAIQRIRFLLEDAPMAGSPASHAVDPATGAAYREAAEVLDCAGAQLSAAYTTVLDEAEKIPTPTRSVELDRPDRLARAAEAALRGTPYQGPIVARARELDARWKAEVAALTHGRQELSDRLSAQAALAWPAIVAATGAVAGLDPLDPAARGRAVLLAGVYNRAGWDFADYDFATRLAGTPVCGNYDPRVLRALEQAWYELDLDVTDRLPWDVVAMVEGPGTIDQRTIVTVRDRDTNLEIGKLEEWRRTGCVRLRIIGLRAGPVAAGPAPNPRR